MEAKSDNYFEILRKFSRNRLFSGEKNNPNSVLTRENLENMELYGSNLRGSDLSFSKLQHTNLVIANLIHVDFRGADMRHADMQGADVRCADFRYADLRMANIRDCLCIGAKFHGARMLKSTYESCFPINRHYGWKDEYLYLAPNGRPYHGDTGEFLLLYGEEEYKFQSILSCLRTNTLAVFHCNIGLSFLLQSEMEHYSGSSFYDKNNRFVAENASILLVSLSQKVGAISDMFGALPDGSERNKELYKIVSLYCELYGFLERWWASNKKEASNHFRVMRVLCATDGLLRMIAAGSPFTSNTILENIDS
jgi:uncharacterized protein YjbI with pentapeptide repeats